MKDFFQLLKAVLVMIPVAAYIIIVGTIFYMTIPLPRDDGKDARDTHNYLDPFDVY